LYPVLDTDVAVLEDRELMRTLVRRIHETGLSVLDVEVVRISPETDVPALAPALDFAAEVGAKWFAVTSERREDYLREQEPAVIHKLVELAEAAASRGVGVMLEFMVFRGIATLEDAVRVVTAAGRPDIRICLDALHLFRSGGGVDSVRALRPELIACLQLNDAPAEPPKDIPREARFDRQLPGQGEFPLRELLSVLPSDLAVAIEVPSPAAATVSPTERAHAAMAAAQELLG